MYIKKTQKTEDGTAKRQRTEGRRPENHKTEGQRSENRKADSRRTEGRRPENHKTEGQRSEDRKADGQRSEGRGSVSRKTEGQRSEDRSSDQRRKEDRRPGSQRQEAGKKEYRRPETGKAESWKREDGKAESQKQKAGKTEGWKRETGKAEGWKREAVRAERPEKTGFRERTERRERTDQAISSERTGRFDKPKTDFQNKAYRENEYGKREYKDNEYGKRGFGEKEYGRREYRDNEYGKRGYENRPGRLSAGEFEEEKNACPYRHECGGCDYQGITYQNQILLKQQRAEELLGEFCPVKPIRPMEDPLHYRYKVHAVLGRTRRGEIISGVYEANSHRVVAVKNCRIENTGAGSIIRDIRKLIADFHMKVYDEDTGYGLFRHIMIRTGYATKEIMVILVLSSPILPDKNHFVQELLKLHPEITTVVINVNDRVTSMVLGPRDIVLYGKGYIEDQLCGCTFRISPQSFYQVNPVQTEFLYSKAIQLAGLTGKERVLDAYCGTGTIGLIAASKAAEVIGVELNADAVKDAEQNARRNGIANARFFCGDAGRFLNSMTENGEKADVIFMDPPRSGSSEEFIRSAAASGTEKIVYVSCNPETLARDLALLTSLGYRAREAWPFDMFPYTEHVETVVLMSRK